MLDRGIKVFAWASALLLIGGLFTLLGSLFIHGWAVVDKELVFGEVSPLNAILMKQRVFDGLFPAIVGTLCLVVLSVGMAVPVGVCAGIFMSEYASPQVRKGFGLLFDILAGVPSIVVGLFGFCATIALHTYFKDFRPCLAISAVSLSVLVLPYLVRTTQVSLQAISPELRKTALALGATKIQNIFHVLLPRAFGGILSGIVLAIGRCAEDTAVIMLTGVVATAGIPKSVFANYEALPFYIYYISSQYADQEELLTGYGAAIILLGICAVLFAIAMVVQKGLKHRSLHAF